MMKLIFIFLIITAHLTHASLIDNFITGAKSFWPRIKGKEIAMRKDPVKKFQYF